MPLSLNDFREEFIAQVNSDSQADIIHPAEAFAQEIKPILQDQLKILDDFELIYFSNDHIGKIRKERVDAASVEVATNQINLIRLDYDSTPEIKTLTNEMVTDYFSSLLGFLTNVFTTDIHKNHAASSPEASLVSDIYRDIDSISKINCIIISDNKLTNRYKTAQKEPSINIKGRDIPVTLTVIDIENIQHYLATGENEVTEIDTANFGCPGIPFIKAKLTSTSYESYLAVVPGQFLANIYKEYNSRILQGNVRSFLTTRAKVNKAIRNTILNEPDKFFSYNNGICTTADSIETSIIDGLPCITHFRNLQIINGGQTTATLALTSIKDKADLSNVFVQMKLTIANDKTDADFVTNIATYANNQTKITFSDLASNHSLYATLASISEHLYTPTRPATRWIFEKNRGSYEQMTLAMSKTEVNKFKMVSPKQQLIKKTDLAKYENSYRRRPFKVAWGAEVNLNDYQEYMVNEYKKDKYVFNQNFYKEIVGKAILYKHIGALISDSQWYKENIGYRAQLVTYTFSKLMEVLETKDQRFDFMQLWQLQNVPTYLGSLLLEIAYKCFEYFYSGSHPEKNISVLCKKEDCWKAIKDIPIVASDETRKILISQDEYKANQISAKHEQKRDNAVVSMVLIYRISANDWQECLNLGREQGILNPKEQSIIATLIKSISTGQFMISSSQTRVVIEALEKLKEAKIFKDSMIQSDEE